MTCLKFARQACHAKKDKRHENRFFFIAFIFQFAKNENNRKKMQQLEKHESDVISLSLFSLL